MSKFTDKIQKFFRAVRRELAGESNRTVVIVRGGHMPGAWPTCTTIPNPENRLVCEDSQKVIIDGPSRDVHRIRCLDSVLGSLKSSFDKASFLNDAEVKARKHIKDLEGSLSRISAYTVENGQKVPVDRLQYQALSIKLSA